MLLYTFSTAFSVVSADTYDSQIKVISDAEYYSWGWVGTPAKPSDAEVAAREISGKVNSKQLSLALNNASNSGRLYLLCLLHRIDKKAFTQKASEFFKADDIHVSVFTGDVLSDASAKSMVKNIALHGCDPLSWPSSKNKK